MTVTVIPTETRLDKLRAALEQARVEDLKCKHTENVGAVVTADNNRSMAIKTAMSLIEVDPELRDLIPAPTIGEKEELKKSLMTEGVMNPLVIWLMPDGHIRLLDGHTRRDTILAHGLPFDVIVKSFETAEQAKDWMIVNQLARRNITPEQRTYLLGKLYKTSKNAQGGDRKSSGQNDHLKTAEQIAEAHNVGEATVRRAEKFAETVDRIGEKSPEAKAQILSGKAEVSSKDLKHLAHASEEDIAAAAEAISKAEPLPEQLKAPKSKKPSFRNLPESELPGFFADIVKYTPDQLLAYFELLIEQYPSAARGIFETYGQHLQTDNQSYISSLIKDDQNLLPFSALISDGTTKEIIQAQLNTPERCRAYLAWVADKQPNQLFVALEDIFEACPSIAREQLLQYYPALSKGQISNLNRRLTDELGQAAVSELALAELIARYDEIEAESKASTKQPDFDLGDSTEARRYLGQIADKEPGEFPAALRRVIEASPDGLATLYAWACSHHDELIGEEAGRKLEALYLQALDQPAPAAELPSTPPPAYVFETEAALIQAASDLTHQKLLDAVQAMPDEEERHKAFALYNLFIDGVKYAESLIQGQPIDPPSLTQLYIFIQEQQVRSAKKAKPKPAAKTKSKK